MHSKDEVNELVLRLAALRPDLAVVPRELTRFMEQEGSHAYLMRSEEEDEALRRYQQEHNGATPGVSSDAFQMAWGRAISAFEEEMGSPGDVPPAMTADIATVMAKLVTEAYPTDKVVFRTMNGDEYTGVTMSAMIRAGTDVGKEYASSILRVCRDYLSRQAQRETVKGVTRP